MKLLHLLYMLLNLGGLALGVPSPDQGIAGDLVKVTLVFL
jgi:hypothetical protein